MLKSLCIKDADLKACSFIKMRLQHRCFPVNSAIFMGKHLCWSLFLIKLQA